MGKRAESPLIIIPEGSVVESPRAAGAKTLSVALYLFFITVSKHRKITEISVSV